MEIWKDIKDFEGLYQVSNMGRVRSYAKIDSMGRYVKGRLMSLTPITDGYLKASLSKNGVKKNYRVHRLVAEAFIPNTENKSEIDHINGDKTDNRVENLRWCTHKENMNNPLVLDKFKSRVGVKNGFSKSVIQFTKGNELIRKWDSMADVKRELGIDSSDISCCCTGNRQTAGGFRWKYYDTETYLIGLMNKNFKLLRDAS